MPRFSLAVPNCRARLTIGAIVVAAAIAGFRSSSPAELPALSSLTGPGRAGTGSFLWFNRAFPDLNVQVSGDDHDDHQFRVEVLLYFHDERPGHCFVAPEQLQVAFNDHRLEINDRGRQNRAGPGRTGIDYSVLFPCQAAWFRSPKGERIERDGPARVTLDLGATHAEMTVATFFARRRMVLRSASTARAGSTVVVSHQPASDEVGSAGSPPSIRMERPGAAPIELQAKDGVSFAGGTWRFVLPRVEPGLFTIRADSGGAVWYAAITSCRGVHRCYAQVSPAVYAAGSELVLTVTD